MSNVSSTEISEMSRLVALMNGNAQEAQETPGPATPDSSDGIESMKAILEQFYRGAGEAVAQPTSEHTRSNHRSVVDTLYEEASYDRPLREAMMLSETEDGVLIGAWEISSSKVSGRNLYNVYKPGEPPIATELTLYEAARGLVAALNDGLPVTSPFARKLLATEQEYANAVHDALHAKYSLRKQSLTESKRQLQETKYGAAVRRAKDAQSRLVDLVDRYPL